MNPVATKMQAKCITQPEGSYITNQQLALSVKHKGGQR